MKAMKTMKAFVRIDAQNQEVQLMDVAMPKIHEDEVLVKVDAFGVGIHDRYFIPNSVDFPYVIGSEGAGTIMELGNRVSGFKLGDRVIFTTILQVQGGSWAEYAVAEQTSLIPLPDNLTFAQGAALPIAGKTALECMRSLQLFKNDTLFIAGASGAIGTLVIQLASSKGVHVSASSSKENHDYMKSLGVEKAVDYNDPNWQTEITEWSKDGVIAGLAIQPGTGAHSIEVVKDDGKLITVSGDNHTVVPVRNISVEQMGHNSDTQQKFIELINAVSKGEIRLVIEKEYAFDEALQALEKTETRHARGKLIVNGLSV